MRIESLSAERFRNLSPITLQAAENVNVIYGDNAQGKTNLIEAIWLFSGSKSFRGAKDSEMLAFGEDTAQLTLSFADTHRIQTAEIRLGENKKTLLNGVLLKSRSELAGQFLTVVFSPAHLSLIQDGPGERRRFLDTAIGQLKPQYRQYLRQYEKILQQRNALLKDMGRFDGLEETLDVWDSQLAKLGTILTIFRQEYVAKLTPVVEELYSGFSESREKLETAYQSTVYPDVSTVSFYTDSNIESFYRALKASLAVDRKVGYTTCGIHRDDLLTKIDGREAKTYGSQGQQRSTVLSLKLAEAQLIRQVSGEEPIMLLDDVMSELDAKRQDFILNRVRDRQVFLTCCDVANTLRLVRGKIFHIKSGKLLHETEDPLVDKEGE